MSLRDLITTDAERVFLNSEEHAESVVQVVAGSANPITAIINRHEPRVSHESGRERIYERILDVSSSATVAATDLWQFDGFSHTVISIQDSILGIRRIRVQRLEIDSQHEARGRVL